MTAVTRDQFEVVRIVVHHLPTGARFKLGSDFIDWGRVGERLPNGEEYSRQDVGDAALAILHGIAMNPTYKPGRSSI